MSGDPRFLVLRGGAIGDFIMTLPALYALREQWPDAYIELIGYPHVARLALENGLVNHVGSLDQAGMARFFSFRPEFDDRQKEHIASFHFVLSYLHDPAGQVKENLEAAGAQRVLYGSPLVEEGHAVEQLLKPLEDLAIYIEHAVPLLTMGDELKEWGRAWLAERELEPALAIHPGSGSPTKNWPAERFVAVARELKGSGRRVFFVIGEADTAVAEVLASAVPEIPVLSGCDLPQLAGVLSACDGYLGNDSGVTHIAAALGLPVVALFGPSEPAKWGPRGPHVKIVEAQDRSMASISPDAVYPHVSRNDRW